METEVTSTDICRVCRSEGLPDRPLFHPCICTGSIKWIHQECLMQWMRYSRKEYCELCSYRFSFTPIYSPDMPRHLPIKDLMGGLLASIGTAIKYWLHYTLVAIAWLGVVPVTACRIYRALFAGSMDAILILPFELLSTENLASDIFQGCFVVTCTLFAFAALVWLREQILHGGGPDWLQRDNNGVVPPEAPPVPQENNIDGAAANVDGGDNRNEEPEPNNEGGVGGGGNNFGIQEENQDDELLNGGANEDNNWIPMEWDRAAEEITWERLLGLDGSLMFLEHVFWVISLNTAFILIFAYSPYHMGIITLGLFQFTDQLTKSTNLHFEGLLITLIGYCMIGLLFIICHRLAGFFGFEKAKRILGLCYVVVKVSMLSVLEIGILPLICGWWLDICSLSLFDATIKDRENSFSQAPGTSIFIHWLVGMVYVYYFASFVLLLREIVRPGVLWFIRNFNDPDFSPIQEMIHLPIAEHIRKLLISAIIFGTTVLLMLWIPIRLLRIILPNFLPYMVQLNNETQVNELSLELLLLQVVLPSLLEQSHTRIWLKQLLRNWCRVIAYILNIHSYLLGDEGQSNYDNQLINNQANEVGGGGLGAAHQAQVLIEPQIEVQPYERPSFFILRLIGLIISICFSLVVFSLVALTLPVWLGRQVMTLWLVGAPPPSPQISSTTNQQTTDIKVHELYTTACGLYLCWLTARAVTLIISWLPQGRQAIIERLKQWLILGLKTIFASIILLGIIPLLFGLLLELVVIVPLRVPICQSPILFIWQDWALGVLYTKIACAVTMMGPDWFLRAAIERAYRDGIRDMNLTLILKDIAIPVIISFGLTLAIPYAITYSIVPSFITNLHSRNLIARRFYPFLLILCLVFIIIVIQIRQFRKLYEHIKNDKYLVGQRLVNYDHRNRSRVPTDSN